MKSTKPTPRKCFAYHIIGKNKGKQCSKNAQPNSAYCDKHAPEFTAEIARSRGLRTQTKPGEPEQVLIRTTLGAVSEPQGGGGKTKESN